MRAALDAGITTFDTADVYANTKAETVLGEALKGERRESLEIFTKVYWPTGPAGTNDTGLSRKHIMESINGSLRGCRPTTSTSTRRTATTTRRRSRRRCRRSPTSCRQGKALYIGVSEWTRRPDPRRRTRWPASCGFQLISNQPQYSMLWRVIEAEVVPDLRGARASARSSGRPIAQGVLTGKYLPGQPPPAGSRATDEKGGADMIERFMNDDVLDRACSSSSPSPRRPA